jgi:flagellar biosynthesis protein FliP
LKPARAPFIPVFAVAITAATIFPATAQEITVNLGNDNALSVRALELFALLTLVSVAPGIAMMVTCFPFMLTVFAILRQAIGIQQSPPNMLIVSLAIFLTWFVMEPVFLKSWENGLSPFINGTLDQQAAIAETIGPFRLFMENRIDETTIAALAMSSPEIAPESTSQQIPLKLLVPSFLLSEVQRGFEIGFLIFLPFLIIDLVVAAVLMSMGMMMVPPATVSLPFKLAFFVLADGWTLLSGALVRSYS